MNHFALLSLLLLLLLLPACHPSRHAQETPATAGATADSRHAQTTPTTVGLLLIPDSAIFLSFRPLPGLELASLLLTPDSFLILDRLHHLFAQGPAQSLLAFLSSPDLIPSPPDLIPTPIDVIPAKAGTCHSLSSPLSFPRLQSFLLPHLASDDPLPLPPPLPSIRFSPLTPRPLSTCPPKNYRPVSLPQLLNLLIHNP